MPPDLLYWTHQDWEAFLTITPWSKVTPFSRTGLTVEDCQGKSLIDFGKANFEKGSAGVFDILSDRLDKQDKPIVLACFSKGTRDRLLTILQEHHIEGVEAADTWPDETSLQAIALTFPLERGFELPKMLLISEQDLLGDRVAKWLLTAKAISSLEPHSWRKRIWSFIETTGSADMKGCSPFLRSSLHDCLCLVYDGGDKLFLPVENIDMITRYGSDDAAAPGSTRIDYLANAKSQGKRIRRVDYLIKIAAERALHRKSWKHPTQYEEFVLISLCRNRRSAASR